MKEQIDKQKIAEMRKDLIEIFDEEYEKRRLITADFTAEKMTAKGYRKQSEGEWGLVVDYGESKKVECSVCEKQFFFMKKGQLNIDRMPYCPKCGAKMKGGE